MVNVKNVDVIHLQPAQAVFDRVHHMKAACSGTVYIGAHGVEELGRHHSVAPSSLQHLSQDRF